MSVSRGRPVAFNHTMALSCPGQLPPLQVAPLVRSSLVTTAHSATRMPLQSAFLQTETSQLPTALEVFSDVCWGHPSQKGTAASLLLQASVPACSHVSSLCHVRPRASSPSSLGLECSTITSLPDSSCLSVHGRKVPSNPSVLQLLTPIHRHSEHPFFSLLIHWGAGSRGGTAFVRLSLGPPQSQTQISRSDG